MCVNISISYLAGEWDLGLQGIGDRDLGLQGWGDLDLGLQG